MGADFGEIRSRRVQPAACLCVYARRQGAEVRSQKREKRGRKPTKASVMSVRGLDAREAKARLPVIYPGACRQRREKSLDLCPSQVSAPATGVPTKNVRTHSMQYGIVFSCAPVSRSVATYPAGHWGSGFVGATTRCRV